MAVQHATEAKRLNLNLSGKAYEDLKKMSLERGRSISELVRLGLGLMKLALTEFREGNKIAVVSKDGKVLKEIVIPEF